jgi:hydroxypyruvate isomerase
MIRLAANISTLFTELPFLDRIDAAAAAGFAAVECQFPYEVPAGQIADRMASAGMPWVLFNAPRGGINPPEFGIAGLPGRERDFEVSVDQAMQYIKAGSCRRVHFLAGVVPQGADRAAHLAQFIRNIDYAAQRLAELNATVMIEPVNSKVDMPGYLLDHTALAVECMAGIRRPNVQLQFDVYHMQIMQGDLMRSIAALLPHIGHIQIADNPGRHEPGSGEIHFPRLLAHIDNLGYTGHIGCEYLPAGRTADGLGWAQEYLGR